MRAAPTLCFALALALALAPVTALADPPVTEPPAVVASVAAPAPVVDPRLALLERDATHARIWFWGFTAAYAVATVAETTLALALEDPGLRIDAAVGAGCAALAVAGMVITPVPRVWRAAADARRTGNIDAAMVAAADAENSGRAWYNHVLVGVVSVASGLILWVGYDRPVSAAITFAQDVIVGEANLLLIPTRAARHRNSAVAWSLAPSLHGASIVGVW